MTGRARCLCYKSRGGEADHLYLLLVAASTCDANSNVTFSAGGYEISVVLSDEDCKVVCLNVLHGRGSAGRARHSVRAVGRKRHAAYNGLPYQPCGVQRIARPTSVKCKTEAEQIAPAGVRF